MPDWLLFVIAIAMGLSVPVFAVCYATVEARRPKPTPEIVPKPEFRTSTCEHCGRPIPLDGRGTVPGEW